MNAMLFHIINILKKSPVCIIPSSTNTALQDFQMTAVLVLPHMFLWSSCCYHWWQTLSINMNECLPVQVIQNLLIIQELLYFYHVTCTQLSHSRYPFCTFSFPSSVKIKVRFTPEQALKDLTGSRWIALHFL